MCADPCSLVKCASDPRSFPLQACQWQNSSASSPQHSSLVTEDCHFLIAGEKILKTELTPSVAGPNAFLIAGDFPSFSPAPHRSNREVSRATLFLFATFEAARKNSTDSKQRRKQFLFATFERFPGFLIATFDDRIAAL
jgi:hypothetical protein